MIYYTGKTAHWHTVAKLQDLGLCSSAAKHASVDPHLPLGFNSVLNGVGIINHCHPHTGTAKPPEGDARAGQDRQPGSLPPERSRLHITPPRGRPGNVPQGLASCCALWLLGYKLLLQDWTHETEHHINAVASLGRPATADWEARPTTTIKKEMINN